MQDADLLAKHPPDNQQRLNQRSQVGQLLDQLLDAVLELRCPHHAQRGTASRRADPLSSRAARKLDLPGLGFDGVAPEATGLCPVFPRKGRNKAAKYLLKW